MKQGNPFEEGSVSLLFFSPTGASLSGLNARILPGRSGPLSAPLKRENTSVIPELIPVPAENTRASLWKQVEANHSVRTTDSL